VQKNLTDKKYWNNLYRKIKFSSASLQHPISKLIKKYISNGKCKTCLEIGCYPGHFIPIFGKLGYELNGIDIVSDVNKGLLQWLKKQGYKVGEFIEGDLLDYQFTKDYDVVCSFGFIEHFTKWDKIIKIHADLVNKDGILIITTPNFRGVIQRTLHYLLDYDNYKKHNIESMNPEQWGKILEKLGFEIIYKGYFAEFDFWVEEQKRNMFQILGLYIIKYLAPIIKLLPKNVSYYAPYCGVVAKKIR